VLTAEVTVSVRVWGSIAQPRYVLDSLSVNSTTFVLRATKWINLARNVYQAPGNA